MNKTGTQNKFPEPELRHGVSYVFYKAEYESEVSFM